MASRSCSALRSRSPMQCVPSEFLAEGAVNRVRPTATYYDDQEQNGPHHWKLATASLYAEKPTVWQMRLDGDYNHFDQAEQSERPCQKSDRDADSAYQLHEHDQVSESQSRFDPAACKAGSDTCRASGHEFWPDVRQQHQTGSDTKQRVAPIRQPIVNAAKSWKI